jgi:hypothetical protein
VRVIHLISYYADLAIGLVLAFLLLSLVVSGVNEGIVRLLAIRSKFLWAYLRDTLDGAEVTDKIPAGLRALDGVLDRLRGVGRWLRVHLVDLLPPPTDGRSRLPATVLGVFAKLPFGKDPRPDFSPQPSPVQSPPLAPAPGTIAAEAAAGVTAKTPAETPADETANISAGTIAEAAPERIAATAAVTIAEGVVAAAVRVTETVSAAHWADPAHGIDQADEPERAPGTDAAGDTDEVVGTQEVGVAGARGIGDAGGAGRTPDVVPVGEGKSLAELLYERLQEIDHSKQGRTSIAEIPPARFAVAVMEIATEHGGVEQLISDLDVLQSPLYRPLKAVWDRASHDVEAFRKGIEDWFDGEMARLTSLYRRYVRWVIASLALAVTLVFSMDALEYGKTLLNDSAYRSSVAAFAGSGPEALAPIKARCDVKEETYACVTDVLSTPAFVQIFTHAPVGVTMRGDSSPAWTWRGGDWWDRLSAPGHWPGFLITLVALLFGAPFWWDMFRRITGIKLRTGTAAK